MSKPTIAIDIDDVLAAHAEGMVAFSNKKWGTNLAVEDYDEHWAQMWQTDAEETERRAQIFHEAGIVSDYQHHTQAIPVLMKLKETHRLIVITSRRRMIEYETRVWIDKYFTDAFDELHFAGFWDNPTTGTHMLTKAQLAKDLRADFLIDDQLKHCIAAADIGIPALLFGNYNWNKTSQLPENVVRVADWQQVAEYFHV
jgi:uncharacterized HAD superfamily protein